MRAFAPRRLSRSTWFVLAGLMAAGGLLAQERFRGGGSIYVPPGTRTAREIPTRSTGTPEWENPRGFVSDVFTFARLRFDAAPRPTYGTRGGWSIDLPDADLNLSYRLQQMTSLKVDPNCRLVRPTDPDLGNYPFLMAGAAGSMAFTAEELVAMRNYLQNGGFLFLTDFWGEPEWAHVERLFREILPGSQFEELPIEHPLYRSVYTIREKVQVPNIRIGLKVANTQVHHRAIFDAKGRMLVMASHNSDDSDGWEREGEDREFFLRYSEKAAYPLAINIIFYVMTH